VAKICLVHLVRARNGIEPLRSFLNTYRTHNAGIEHDLLVVFKGFGRRDSLRPFEMELSGLVHRTLTVNDYGFDLAAYFKAAAAIDHEYICFLNSFSRILCPNWLEVLFWNLTREGVGIVGATASWASVSTLPMARVKAIRPPEGWFQNLLYLPPIYALILSRARLFFPSFPNPHVRTNGFMMRRSVFNELQRTFFIRKIDAHRFESGNRGLTRQVMAIGLRPLVVGRDGMGYEVSDWAKSMTLWQGEQQNLLIADNRTDDYLRGTDQVRLFLSEFAWGPQALPTLQSKDARDLPRVNI
jgi:hypothetical protein